MHIITLLGTGNYGETIYRWDRNDTPVECQTKFFGEAAATWFPDADVTVLVTVEAEDRYWAEFSARVPRAVKREIPSGLSETELWQIFAALTEVVEALPSGEEIVFDVTHGFRSMQLLLQLGAAYLNTVKRITTRHVLYGAFVPGQTPTPVLDLAPFLRLLDWANAANQFSATGDARPIGELLSRESTPFRSAANAMQSLSIALLTCRSGEVKESAATLVGNLQMPGLQTLPFRLISSRIESSFRPLGALDDVSRELDQITWYIDNGHYPHGILLAREWMVALVMRLESISENHIAEKWLSCRSNPKLPDFIAPAQEWQKPVRYWGRLSQLRNDIGHFKGNSSASQIRKRALKIPEELREEVIVPLGISV